MKLPNPFNKFLGKTGQEEVNYLTFTLTPSEILAAIWQFEEEKPKIIGFDKRSYSTDDNLIHQAAATIDKAASLAQTDVTKVTYGLTHNWLENGQLKSETAKILKNLSEDLELEAQAYISLAQAINHLLKVEESITPQAVLIGNFEDFCEVHLIENNKVADTKTYKGSVDLEKIIALVGQLKKDDKDLPARIILYGEDRKLAKEITENSWQNLFVHEPKIDVVGDSDLAKAVAFAQAEDILGYEVAKEAKVAKKKDEESGQLGFMEGEDILLTKGATELPIEEKIESEKAKSEENLPIEKTHPLEVEKDSTTEPEARRKPETSQGFIESLASIGWFPKLSNVFKNRPSAKVTVIILGILITSGVIGAFAIGQFLTDAQIIIKVQSKSLEQDFSTQTTGEEITAVASGEQKAVATGNKKIGQNAKGEVTVFNITSSPKTFSKGATIITNSGLKFTLDEQVEATSASKPGQASITKTQVTAIELGPQYNLDPGQQFSFTQYDEFSYWAQNDAPLTGGEEKEVTVVSVQDQDKLKNSLQDTLTEKTKSQIKEKTQGQNFDDQTLVIKVLKSQFDKKIDEEASLVNLSMEIEASVIIYDQAKLKENLARSIGDEVPENWEARAEDIQISDLTTKRTGNNLVASGKFQAKLVPKLNEEELKNKIAGIGQKTARTIIKEIPEVVEVEFKNSPNLLFTSSIPRNKSKIMIKVEAI